LKKFLSIVKKDFLLLLRDWPGLAILFVMPAVLLIVTTLVQENAIPTNKSGFKIIIVNADSSVLGESIVNDLINSGYLNFTKFNTVDKAKNAILDGKYQLAIIIPDSATEKLFNLLKVYNESDVHSNDLFSGDLTGIIFLYDPGLQRIVKNAVVMPMKTAIQLSAVKVLMAQYTEEVNKSVKQHSSDFADNLAKKDFFENIPDFPYKNEVIKRFSEELTNKATEGLEIKLPVSPTFNEDIIRIDEETVRKKNAEYKPNVLQNNIPAFTLFAMFFIVIPLAGSIINEKDHGTYKRLRTLPVSFFEIIFAKVTVYLTICILQFIFLMFIGVYIMPILGESPSLDLQIRYPALFLALTASSFAAIGFGILVGIFASTHSQAATFGSVMVVILAMLGGIFVPAYMLPDILRKISMVSPLRWGTDAFLGVFARYEGIDRIWSELCLLFGFFGVSLFLSFKIFKRET
jgi:ABC-2 type transport system permease protein